MEINACSTGIDLIALANSFVNGGELASPAANRCRIDI
jgi:hypothetical protein